MQLTYNEIKSVIESPPSEHLVNIFHDLEDRIGEHDKCITDPLPFQQLETIGNFCITASSIQSKYVAMVLGKHTDTTFPTEIIQMFFNVDPSMKMQFAQIKGIQYDGCIVCFHQEKGFFDLQKIYDVIYLTCG